MAREIVILVVFHWTVKKQYKKLSPQIRTCFAERMELMLVDRSHSPLRLHALTANRKPLLSINAIADYRAWFYSEKTTITVTENGTHCELYP